MKKAEFRKLEKRIIEFLKQHHFERQDDRSLYQWEGQFADIDLSVKLQLGYTMVNLFMRWSDPELARRRRGNSVNPYTGKDNFHFTGQTADDMYWEFNFAVAQGANLHV